MREVKCNLCGFNKYQVLFRAKGAYKGGISSYTITDDSVGKHGRIVKCHRCGLVYVNPRPGEEELLSAYKEMSDSSYAQEESGRRISARRTLNLLEKLIKTKGRILDIGAASGILLSEAKSRGWQVDGVELSQWAVDYAKKHYNIDIFCGQLKEARFTNSYFDAVVMKETIEHLLDPKEILVEVRRVLKPNGILCVNTPDIDSRISRFLKARWWGIKQEHIFYFTRKTLLKMLESCGFKPLRLRGCSRTFSFRYWLDRFGSYNRIIFNIMNFFVKNLSLENFLVSINFADQIEVFVRKSRKLEFVSELESRPEVLKNKRMKKIVVLPAYNAARTLEMTLRDIPREIIDEIILVDDVSTDNTVEIAQKLGLKVIRHNKNMGYGANQKTCYTKALSMGADIVVMVHPDYQYDPTVIPHLIEPIEKGNADAVFGSRMMKGGALEGGMPLWKHNANILLTALENVILGTYLSEYHSGFRAYSAQYLRTVNFMANSDGFVFDTEIIVQGVLHYLKIEEIPIRTRYFDEASSIKFLPSVIYGFGILKTLLKYLLHTRGIIRFKQFK
ncbi:MAG: methyltransferase domain-containing protein [Candidatus Omnitrophota bacterium]